MDRRHSMSNSIGSRADLPNDGHDFTVQQPLLGPAFTADGSQRENDQHNILHAARPLSLLVLYFMAIHFLLAFAEIILVAPLIRLFENSLCLSYYGFPDGGVAEALCKIPDIQKPLATIRGWKSMFDTLPGLKPDRILNWLTDLV